MQMNLTNAKIAQNNEAFEKLMRGNDSEDEYEREYEQKKKRAMIKKIKKDKELKIIRDNEIKNRSEADQKKINNIMEKFFISWLIERDFTECKNMCDVEHVIFYDKQNGNDSHSFHIAMIQMYYYQQTYEKEKTKIETHVTDGNTLWYKAKKRDDSYLEGFIEFTFNAKFKITRLEVGITESVNNEVKKTNDKFNGVGLKKYNYKADNNIEVKPLALWDHEYFLQQQKGTLYALMFKLYKTWLITEDVDSMARLMAPDAKLYDKVMNKDFFNGRDVANYFYTFVAHHFVSGIYVRQYKILDNELVVRVHWPEKSQWVDIMVVVKIDKDTNLFTEIVFRKAYFDAFKEPTDANIEAIKKMENVYIRRIQDRNRRREDFKSAVFFRKDKNMKDLNISTFATSDTEVFLADKIVNEKKSDTKIINIEPREQIVPSPKPPLKLIYDFKTPSNDTNDIFCTHSPKNKKNKTKKSASLSSDHSFLEIASEKSENIEELKHVTKSEKQKKT